MIGTWVVTIAMFASSQEMGQARMQAAYTTLQRLAANVLSDKANASTQEQAEHRARKAELTAQLIYIGTTHEIMAIGNWNDPYQSNFLAVIQQTVQAGEKLALLPEEALCWERAGLDLVASHHELLQRQVAAGKASQKSLDKANVTLERFRRSYHQALARCLISLD